MATNFLSLGPRVAIDGVLSRAALAAHAATYRSLLYLCPDQDGDNGVEEGGTFADAHAAFGGNAVQVPFFGSKLPAAPFEKGSAEETRRLVGALSLYSSISDALDKLDGPIIITCKSARRAGLAWKSVDFIQNHLDEDVESAIEEAKVQGLTFVESPAMVLWFKTVVDWFRRAPKGPALSVRQLFEKTSSTYTYLVFDEISKECIIIDPVLETAERDAKLITELGLTCKLALNTHVHADHITGTGKLKSLLTPSPPSAIAAVSKAAADVQLGDYSVFEFGRGRRQVIALSTPGHTEGCLTYVIFESARSRPALVFTGDALLIRGCGRTDFQGGSAETLYDSVHSRLFTLPGSTIVYPAHNYEGVPFSTIDEERRLNPRLTKGKAEFCKIMDELGLPRPAKMDDAVPANLKCGL